MIDTENVMNATYEKTLRNYNEDVKGKTRPANERIAKAKRNELYLERKDLMNTIDEMA